MSPEEMEPDEFGRPARKSGAVTAVAVVNFVLGGFLLLCGLVAMLGGALLGNIFGQAGAAAKMPQGMDPEQAKVFNQLAQGGGGLIATIAAFIGICYLIVAVPAIIAGVGVLKRAQWGRILTLVLGVIAGLFALLSLASLPAGIFGLVIYGGYCVLVFVILLNKQYAAEFQ
jgi:hypothetical protein